MSNIRNVFLSVFLIIYIIPINALSQSAPGGPCPPGAVPIPGQGRCGSPAEASAINSGGKGNSAPTYTEVWEDRFGAIAVDYAAERMATVEGERSERSAKNKALSKCGTNRCKVVSSVRNGCQVSAYGGGGVAYGAGLSLEGAVKDGMLKCQLDGSVCEITYSGCSLPVRVK
ncbi:DUF4189 domain-containing protein [Lysobacter pythonis]|uniref:DUF4189 domain-containing protein n=1 Tax=Solilutibacter pythonis TaxID=2483112 RepID=A0A3M2HMC1_9GAMM|nr:DUF4189 domain-containing protein [Lysobacter pythonis]RMH87427.1 DUF4189 domain-containing protein [Lysobacter pythonis]